MDIFITGESFGLGREYGIWPLTENNSRANMTQMGYGAIIPIL
jgi:hypothetical protein